MASIRTNGRTVPSARPRHMSDQQCQKILAEHTPEPLPPEAAQAVHTIVERAEAQYENAKG
jgi:hypothetical protein